MFKNKSRDHSVCVKYAKTGRSHQNGYGSGAKPKSKIISRSRSRNPSPCKVNQRRSQSVSKSRLTNSKKKYVPKKQLSPCKKRNLRSQSRSRNYSLSSFNSPFKRRQSRSLSPKSIYGREYVARSPCKRAYQKYGYPKSYGCKYGRSRYRGRRRTSNIDHCIAGSLNQRTTLYLSSANNDYNFSEVNSTLAYSEPPTCEKTNDDYCVIM